MLIAIPATFTNSMVTSYDIRVAWLLLTLYSCPTTNANSHCNIARD
jgi:hypothetical protein